MRIATIGLMGVVLVGCAADTSASGMAGGATGGPSTASGEPTTSGDAVTAGGADTGGLWGPGACPAIYDQERLPTFELELAVEELAAIEDEWEEGDDNHLAEHALATFKYEDIVITDATVRLRGNSSHWPKQGKMQLEVSFNTIREKGRFMGLKHVLFDAAAYNRSFLRDRLALHILRDAGVAAPCANNARVVLNGEYYGLFMNIEKVDSEFLERNFEDPDGNLYKRGGGGWERKNNEEDLDRSDIEALDAAETVSALTAVLNLEQALLEWAAEAVVPDRDGAWAGGLNLYVYHDPGTGFHVIPWDMDDSFTRLPADTDPYTFRKPAEVFHGRPFYDIATADPAWFARYIDSIERVVERAYDPVVLEQRIDAWAAQIAGAVEDDPNRPFSVAEHVAQVEAKRTFVAERAAFLATWLACWRAGGIRDEDGACEPP